MLTINNVSKAFADHQILKNINLTIDTGTIVGLAGPSGGGKSTLLRIIQKLETIDRGDISYDHKVGFMFQDFQLFPHMNVFENLSYAPKQVNKSTSYHAEIDDLLNKLGMIDKKDFYPQKLSGGQKQRVALARSLMMKPDLLLCDEPTSGLDVATIDDIVDLLKSVCNDKMTMIIASHDLDFLSKIADRIIVLKDGSIVADIKTSEDEDIVASLKKLY
jgi:polar amino acid transport system ATP-binding protein